MLHLCPFKSTYKTNQNNNSKNFLETNAQFSDVLLFILLWDLLPSTNNINT